MILLANPKVTKPKNRRLPLSILSLAAVLEGREDYDIVDGNLDPDPARRLDELAARAELLAVTVMPGPQMVAAIELCRGFREKNPGIPIVWGGYFPSLYADAALNASYVDCVIRGQGEDALLDLIGALRGRAALSSIAGLSYKEASGKHLHNAERPFRSPNEFPWLPYHRVDVAKYLMPTFLGSRTTAHQASVGCPYQCNFCGVISVYGSREKMETPQRTAAVLDHLKTRYGANAVQFYDNNFFVGERHARELAARLKPLGMRWWCEARIDALLRYSDGTLAKIRDAGATMIFFGAESGSDWVLEQMKKNLTTAQTLELARRLKRFGIIPEFSFVVGNPRDPERDARECMEFIRKIKKIYPESEIILQHYSPTPQRHGMYGGVENEVAFPATPEEWARPEWLDYVQKINPRTPWSDARVKRRLDDFETVISARWPTTQDIFLPRWGRALLQGLSGWRYSLGFYRSPKEIEWAQRLVALRKPRFESL